MNKNLITFFESAAHPVENGITDDDLVDEKGSHEDRFKFASKADIVVCCLILNKETVSKRLINGFTICDIPIILVFGFSGGHCESAIHSLNEKGLFLLGQFLHIKLIELLSYCYYIYMTNIYTSLPSIDVSGFSSCEYCTWRSF